MDEPEDQKDPEEKDLALNARIKAGWVRVDKDRDGKENVIPGHRIYGFDNKRFLYSLETGEISDYMSAC